MSTELTPVPLTESPGRFDDKFDRVLRWARDTREDSDPMRIKIPAELEQQFRRWNLIYGLLSAGSYSRIGQQIGMVKKAIPGITDRTARNLLNDTKRFFAALDAPNLAWEKQSLMASILDDIDSARRKGDYKSIASLHKLYATLIGADQPENPVENRTIVNVINYNPEQLGGQQISDEQLKAMVENMMADDKKKNQELFADFEDVTTSEEKPT